MSTGEVNTFLYGGHIEWVGISIIGIQVDLLSSGHCCPKMTEIQLVLLKNSDFPQIWLGRCPQISPQECILGKY